jgi:hypothetical protein
MRVRALDYRCYPFYLLYWYKSTNTDAAHHSKHSSDSFTALLDQTLAQKENDCSQHRAPAKSPSPALAGA